MIIIALVCADSDEATLMPHDSNDDEFDHNSYLSVPYISSEVLGKSDVSLLFYDI